MFHFETRTENKHSDFRDIIKYDTHVRFSRLTMHSEIRFLILMKNTACVDEYACSVCDFHLRTSEGQTRFVVKLGEQNV